MCCGGSGDKKLNTCPCVYREYPILDLQQIYMKASNELQKMETIAAVGKPLEFEISEINKCRLEEEPAFDF
jgi:hypothetical protein